MKAQTFLDAVKLLATTNLIRVQQPRQHGQDTIGETSIGATDRQNKRILKDWGGLQNILIFEHPDHVNAVLVELGLDSLFFVKPTKSGTSSRIHNVE